MTYQSMSTALKVKKVSETSEDNEAPLANNNFKLGRNRAGGRNNDCSVENKEEIWTETFTRTNLPEYLEIHGPKVILDRTKTELDFFDVIPFEFVCMDYK